MSPGTIKVSLAGIHASLDRLANLRRATRHLDIETRREQRELHATYRRRQIARRRKNRR